ncbi:uncharacterized protein J3R85_018357 [Psidium guajava]|nr:uncharacterized protein J3R85_018357 [Psidium guajava]
MIWSWVRFTTAFGLRLKCCRSRLRVHLYLIRLLELFIASQFPCHTQAPVISDSYVAVKSVGSGETMLCFPSWSIFLQAEYGRFVEE